ncbi:MAG: cobalt-precorrin-5B (C(1))-methyltransferase, partial [Methanomethylovorans sp.]|nr:cobalt-precorrin-5B (C(1))-methyltransferase [Methanomethylovorans sp.]
MIDPVNRSKIPDEWVARSNVPRDELIKGIESGRLVLLSDGSVLRRGYTTGTTATAAAKASVLSL